MSQNVSPFQWDAVTLEALELLAEDKLSDEEIAERSGVSRRQVTRWKSHPEFRARLDERIAEIEKEILQSGLARRSMRLQRLYDRCKRMDRVMEDRAACEALKGVPGATSGLLVPGKKTPTVDTGLLRELREHDKHIAIEVGQWTERQEHQFSDVDRAIAAELGKVRSRRAGTLPVDSSAGVEAEPPGEAE